MAGLAALGAIPGAGLAQPESLRIRGEEYERILEQIEAAQKDEGLRSPSLISMLTDLGLLYQEDGDYELAAAALEEARHVVRVNFGLHTLEQLPLMEQAVENAQAQGDIPMVQALEEELLDLAKRHPEDLRTASIYRDAARRRMDVLRRLLGGDRPPEVYPEAGLWDLSKKEVVTTLVTQAQIHYTHAAEVILRNELYSSGELRDLEMQIIRSSDLFRSTERPSASSFYSNYEDLDLALLFRKPRLSTYAMHRDTYSLVFDSVLEIRSSILLDLAGATGPDDPAWGFPFDGVTSRYELGRDSYRRLAAYAEKVSSDSPTDVAAWQSKLEAYLQLADWDLLYSRNGVALDEYAQIYATLESTGVAGPLIEEIFAPPIPTVLPAFKPNPLLTVQSARYIDVSFDVTKFGESRRVGVSGATPDVSAAEKDALVALIKASRYRPRVANGKLGRSAPVAFRYYLID